MLQRHTCLNAIFAGHMGVQIYSFIDFRLFFHGQREHNSFFLIFIFFFTLYLTLPLEFLL